MEPKVPRSNISCRNTFLCIPKTEGYLAYSSPYEHVHLATEIAPIHAAGKVGRQHATVAVNIIVQPQRRTAITLECVSVAVAERDRRHHSDELECVFANFDTCVTRPLEIAG
jgi:hypothetical protein